MNIQGRPSPAMYERPRPVPPPSLARIAKITVEDYRAFPAGDTLLLNLGPEGKNLLLYGENGSGQDFSRPRSARIGRISSPP